MLQAFSTRAFPLHPALQGRAVLAAEDNFFQAQALRASGVRLIGPFALSRAAIEAPEAIPDAAVLDIDLRGCAVCKAADPLAGRGIPFLFATGHDPALLPAAPRARPVCGKPFAMPAGQEVPASLCAGLPDAGDGRRAAGDRDPPKWKKGSP